MNNKVSIEITADEGVVTLELFGKTYRNTWYKKMPGIYSTRENGIDDQLDTTYGEDIEEEHPGIVEISEALQNIDVTELMDLFKQCDDPE